MATALRCLMALGLVLSGMAAAEFVRPTPEIILGDGAVLSHLTVKHVKIVVPDGVNNASADNVVFEGFIRPWL